MEDEPGGSSPNSNGDRSSSSLSSSSREAGDVYEEEDEGFEVTQKKAKDPLQKPPVETITFRVKDRVMQVKNNYEKGVFNGDVGSIKSVDEKERKILVDYTRSSGNIVEYDASDLERGELLLAYSCSIHKSQGSEFPVVIVLMTSQHTSMLQRNLIYTAITRGRKHVFLIGSRRAVQSAVHNNESIHRRTALCQKLIDGKRAEGISSETLPDPE